MRTEPPFFQLMAKGSKKVESSVRDRFGRRDGEDKRTVSIGQLAASVAYYYKLSPAEISQFSGPQLVLWHERACVERGEEKLLDLQISVTPHTERPDKAFAQLQKALRQMTEPTHG